jgi:tRNA pseudouridine38-40 synthase
MARYFLELAYKGTAYHGFQIQNNAPSVQEMVERALKIRYKEAIELTGSSRTDKGVHALQNFFHFDTDLAIDPQQVYNLNALLPDDISVVSVREVHSNAHARFDAIAREYQYHIYRQKNPFMLDRGWHYPYHLDMNLLNEAAAIVKQYKDFTSFSKRNTQVNNFLCTIEWSEWKQEGLNGLVYTVRANRFLRGMVRGLVGTMIKVGRGKMSVANFEEMIKAKEISIADFSTPPHGLFLAKVVYP